MVRLRPAEPPDEWAFWELRREIQPDLSREDHLKWWYGTWEHRYLAYDGPAFVGVIRIGESWDMPHKGEVHLQVAKKEQGKGFGAQMLATIQRVASDLGMTHLVAHVMPGNIASQKAFEGASWEPTRYEVKL